MNPHPPAYDGDPVSAEVEEQAVEVAAEAVDEIIAEADSVELEEVDTVEGLSIDGVEDESSDPALYTPEGVSIEATFTDPRFRAYVASNFDGDGDGFLSKEEIDMVGEINLNVRGEDGEELHDADGRYLNLGIHSLKGIEVFTSLGCLTCYDNPLTESPDLSNNVGLVVLELGGCGLTTLDVSSNTNLRLLHVEGNPIKELDISKCATLANIVTDNHMQIEHYFVVGAIVTYADNMDDDDYENDVELWVNTTTKIIAGEGKGREPRSINIYATFPDEGLRSYLTETFDSNKDGMLTEDEIAHIENDDEQDGFHLHEREVASLSGLEVFVGLRWLDLWRIDGLEVLDLTALPWLEGANACECNLKQVIIPPNARLDNLHLECNRLTQLDISNCPQEYRDQITAANGSYRENDAEVVYVVHRVDDEDEWIEDVLTLDSDVEIIGGASPLPTIPSLSLGDDGPFKDDALRKYMKERYDLDKNDKLSPRESAEVYDIDLHQFSGNEDDPYVVEPETNTFAGLGVESLMGIENFPWLHRLSCSNNPIGAIDVDLSVFKDLDCLECFDCNLTQLDVTHNPELRWLDCTNNALTELNISHNPKLCGLFASGNNMTELDITGCPILVEKTDLAKTKPQYFGNNNSRIYYPFTVTETWEEEDGIHTEERDSALECDATVTIKGLIDSTPKPNLSPAAAPAAAAPAPAAPAPIVIPAVKKFSKSAITAAPGATAQLDLGGATGKKFKSSNKKVAKVSGNGMVTFKKKGKVTITCTAKRGGKKAKIKFTVTNP